MSSHDTPAARALRAIQKYDERTRDIEHRDLLIEAMDALGKELGLACSGVHEGTCFYDHSGDTCPIHEWLVPSDSEAASEVVS